MNDPHVGQRVWATELEGTFTVTALDRDRSTVDLEAIRPNMMFRSASSIPWEVTSGTRGFGRPELVDPAISFESQGEAARTGASQARPAASVIYVTPYSPRHW